MCQNSCKNQCLYTLSFYLCLIDLFKYANDFILSISDVQPCTGFMKAEKGSAQT